MNLFSRLIRGWKRRGYPRAAEPIEAGQIVAFTDASRTRVRGIPRTMVPASPSPDGIALESARRDERVQVLQRGQFVIGQMPDNDVYLK